MSSTVAALPPPTHQIPHLTAYDGAPDVPEYAFSELWQDKKEGLTFGDVLDIINPLQHIPVVSAIYRLATGDEIGVGSRLLGGAIFGGPLGVLITGLTAIAEEISGETVDERVASLWNSSTDKDGATTRVAAAGEKGTEPAFVPEFEDSFVSTRIQPAIAGSASGQNAIPVRAAAITEFARPQTTGPVHPGPRSFPGPPVTVAPLTAIHRVHNRPPQVQQGQEAAVDNDDKSQRIAKAVERAQHAQAGLLLASLEAENSEQPRDGGARLSTDQTQPFTAHPYLLPRGAPPHLISRAMEQAMAKYQATLQRRDGSPIASVPSRLPSPVR